MSADGAAGVLDAVAARALKGERLEAAAIRRLLGLHDILALGALADDVRRARHGARTTFVRVHAVEAGMPATWTAAIPAAAGEVRIGGVPESPAQALECVAAVHAASGGRPVRGFALDALQAAGWQAGDYARLQAAGLQEIASITAHASPALVQMARDAGLAVRVVAADVPAADLEAWLLAVRALQDAVDGLEAVAPLPRTFDPTTPTTGFQDVRLVAVSRLALETVPHIQVDWRLYGPKLAQVALTVGADDLDAVSPIDDPAIGPRRVALEEVRRNVTAAALTAVERNGRFEIADAV